MFLTAKPLAGIGLFSDVGVRFLTCAGLLVSSVGLLHAKEQGCILEVPVYVAFGHRLASTISRISPGERRSVDLLRLEPPILSVQGDRVLFRDNSLLRRVIVVTVEYSKNMKVVQPILLMQCP